MRSTLLLLRLHSFLLLFLFLSPFFFFFFSCLLGRVLIFTFCLFARVTAIPRIDVFNVVIKRAINLDEKRSIFIGCNPNGRLFLAATNIFRDT